MVLFGIYLNLIVFLIFFCKNKVVVFKGENSYVFSNDWFYIMVGFVFCFCVNNEILE